MRLSAIRRLVAGTGLAAAAVTVALLPGIGPMLDHHYAGRQPGHSHLHVGALFPDHPHGYEVHHDHQHSEAAASGGEKGRGGLVVLASYSGAVVGHAHIYNSASQTELSFPDPGETPYSFPEQDAALHQQSFVVPPTQPPQV